MTTLLLVHAHPDDECIATGGVILRAHDDRVRVVLLTATRGEEGDIHNMDADSVRPRLGEVRTAELMRSCEILGVVPIRLVEVADARQDERLGILLFECKVLRDERRRREVAQRCGQTAVPARPH